MAKFFIDANHNTEKEAMIKQDGTALTLTNSVRILYDDALSSRLLSVLLHRIADKINETEAE